MKLLITSLVFLLFGSAYAQKEAYVPLYILDPATVEGSQFTWTKTAESDNFMLIWGDSVGVNPELFADPSLNFNPEEILDTLETIYSIFISYGFADESEGTNLSLYKIPIIMYNTWGFSGSMGYANGGDADGVIGAFWVHPIAMDNGHVAAHELTHALQAQNTIDYRTTHGLGGTWYNSGIFWETHANFMRNLIYPMDVTAWGMDVYHIETWGDWKNTYENYQLLFSIMELDGIEMVNRLWRESYSEEYPIQTYKRLKGLDQDRFNTTLFEHIRKMATFDFAVSGVGDYMRIYRANDMLYNFRSVQAIHTILQQNELDQTHYRVPIELAPEEYAYNIIPIYPHPDSCAVIVKFKGHTTVNEHCGWRYGFVTVNEDGIVSRYSETYDKNEKEIAITLEEGETGLYFVVMGAPKDAIMINPENDTWKGYPKHYRYPYELKISGGVPEGFQDAASFRPQIKYFGGPHSNGGGWVESTATVDPSVFVGSHAHVLGYSNLSGNVRIENTALVRDATLTGNVIVKDNAFVSGGFYSEDAILSGQSFAENNIVSGSASLTMRAYVANYQLSGDIEVGGDVVVYNETGDCDNGVYYRMTNYYENNLLECDGRTPTHPQNQDVNGSLIPFLSEDIELNCNCLLLPDCLTLGMDEDALSASKINIYPNPSTGFVWISGLPADANYEIYSAQGMVLKTGLVTAENHLILMNDFAPGIYLIRVQVYGREATSHTLLLQ